MLNKQNFWTFIFISGTRFRPLSLDLPKPLFAVAGFPIIQHHIEACVQIPFLKEIIILGYYGANEMSQFVGEMVQLYKLNIRYQEYLVNFALIQDNQVQHNYQVSSRIWTSWHCWWSLSFPRSNSLWKPRLFFCAEWRCMCWFSINWNARVPQDSQRKTESNSYFNGNWSYSSAKPYLWVHYWK